MRNATLRTRIVTKLTHNLLAALALLTVGVAGVANTEQTRMTTPGISECWNGAAALITTVVGECP